MHFPRGADYLLHLTQSLHSFWGFSRSKDSPWQVLGDGLSLQRDHLTSLPKHLSLLRWSLIAEMVSF